jgi:ankyrin repeat protein
MLGDAVRVQEFLKQDASLANATGSHGIPVLYFAALSGNTAVAEVLDKYGGGEGKEVALQAAVLSGSSDMVNWLLAKGVKNVNLTNYENKTPLTLALERGYFEIADMIQSEGGVELNEE